MNREKRAILTCLRHAPRNGLTYEDIKDRVGGGIHDAIIELRRNREIIRDDAGRYTLRESI